MKLKFNILIVLIFHGYHVMAQDIQVCAAKNSTCEQEAYRSFLKIITEKGYPEINIPVMSPFQLSEVTMLVMDFIKLKLVSGECSGIETCKLLNYETKLENLSKITELLCERIVIQGTYELSTDQYFRHIAGDLSGSGNGTIILDDWSIQMTFPFAFKKRADGEIYTEPYFEEGKYFSEVRKSITVTADNIMLNDNDVTDDVMCFINQYWKEIQNTGMGYSFHKLSLGFYHEIFGKFFGGIPATKYFSDDLTPFI